MRLSSRPALLPRARARAPPRLRCPGFLLALALVAVLAILGLTVKWGSDLRASQRSLGVSTSSQETASRQLPGSFPVARHELVLAFPSDGRHRELVEASRPFRQGVRTVVAINDTALVGTGAAPGETYVYYPDDSPLRGQQPGDTRAAIVPFLAHAVLGDTYKWLLYGDDDTFWFLDNVLALLEKLDPDMPYFISDHLWWSDVRNTIGSHPNHNAPRCVPCGYTDAGSPGEPFRAVEGCPCVPRLLCAADAAHALFNAFDADCHVPIHGERTYSVHGGAGALLSVGLLRRVPLATVEACIADLGHGPGGDNFISVCLWRAGYAITDPGISFAQPALRAFDAGLKDPQGITACLRAFEEGTADAACEARLETMMTSHIRSRRFPSMAAAARAMTELGLAYQQYTSSSATAGSSS